MFPTSTVIYRRKISMAKTSSFPSRRTGGKSLVFVRDVYIRSAFCVTEFNSAKCRDRRDRLRELTLPNCSLLSTVLSEKRRGKKSRKGSDHLMQANAYARYTRIGNRSTGSPPRQTGPRIGLNLLYICIRRLRMEDLVI